MKYLAITALAIMLLPAIAGAKPKDNKDGSLNITDAAGRDVVSISPSNTKDKGFSLSVSGFEINFGSGDSRKTSGKVKTDMLDPLVPHNNATSARQQYRTSLPLVEFGLTALGEGDYRAYTPFRDGYVERKQSGAYHIQWNVLRFSESINSSNTLGFNSAFGLAWDKYSFNSYMIDESGRPIRIGGSDTAAGVTKINTFSLNVPIVFGYTKDNFRVGAGVYGNLAISHKTRFSHPMFTDAIKSNAGKPQAGATLRVRFKSVSLFVNYAFTSPFESETAPSVHPITVGIGLW